MYVQTFPYTAPLRIKHPNAPNAFKTLIYGAKLQTLKKCSFVHGPKSQTLPKR